MISMFREFAEAQMQFARFAFERTNTYTLGSFIPVTKIFDACCSTYMDNCDRTEDFWMKMLDEKERAVGGSPETRQRSSQEEEIMARTRPDYSNLRAAANGETKPRSILDDDSLWQGHGSTAKSAHKYDEADRGRDFQRQNNYA